MTRDELIRWLDARRPAPPDALAARLHALADASPLALPDHLAALGLALLRRVSARPGDGRALALDLLAADALVTYAFEAQAEADVDGLGPLADVVARDG
jgi:hypothetical protein